MDRVVQRIRQNPMFRAAIAAPIAIMIVFSLFNLTAPPDQSRLPSAINVAIVDLDEGAAGIPVPLSQQLLAGLRSGLPVGVAPYVDEATARQALDDGEVTAVLVFPAGFSAAVMAGGSVDVRFIAGQHLSVAETQFSSSLAGQIGASLSAAIAGIRLANATGGAPPAAGAGGPPPAGANVDVELLYVAAKPAALSAPFVMTFATWIAAFVGALMGFLATRRVKGPNTVAPVSMVRSLLPIIVSAVASICLAVVVVWTTDNWGSLVSIWLFIWLALASTTLLVAGLFAVLGFFAIIVALPVVFYQSALSGTQIPVAAAPEWLSGIAENLPFSDLGAGYRSLVIGGPEGTLPLLLLFAVAAIGLALIWIGTWIFHRVIGGGASANA